MRRQIISVPGKAPISVPLSDAEIASKDIRVAAAAANRAARQSIADLESKYQAALRAWAEESMAARAQDADAPQAIKDWERARG
jgi:hypothetical protein